jgi:SAM-dependent methyltransferase
MTAVRVGAEAVPMDRNERLKSELAFQADRASRMGPIRPTPGHVVERYREARHGRVFPAEFLFAHLKDIRDTDVLDFGCGDGALSVILARLGARVTAVDISPQLIEVARQRAEADGVAGRIQFIERDITAAPLEANQFDFAVCNLVLHHVDLRSVVPLIVASLKPEGTAVIVEPIAFSPWLQRVRDRVPIDKRASPGERPLNEDEVNFVVNELVGPEWTYFNLLGRLRRLFPNRHRTDTGHRVTRACLFLLYGLDRLLLTVFPGLQKFCGSVAIVGKKPARGRG